MPDMDSAVELYHSDIIKLESVLAEVNKYQGTRQNLEVFIQEIEGRFAEAGYRVEVVTFQDEHEPDFYGFDLNILDRIEPVEFDHEKMAHEVQHDILGLSQPGAVTKDGVWIEPPTVVSMPEKKPAAE